MKYHRPPIVPRPLPSPSRTVGAAWFTLFILVVLVLVPVARAQEAEPAEAGDAAATQPATQPDGELTPEQERLAQPLREAAEAFYDALEAGDARALDATMYSISPTRLWFMQAEAARNAARRGLIDALREAELPHLVAEVDEFFPPPPRPKLERYLPRGIRGRDKSAMLLAPPDVRESLAEDVAAAVILRRRMGGWLVDVDSTFPMDYDEARFAVVYQSYRIGPAAIEGVIEAVRRGEIDTVQGLRMIATRERMRHNRLLGLHPDYSESRPAEADADGPPPGDAEGGDAEPAS